MRSRREGRSSCHVYAPWCLQCHMQAYFLDGLKDDPAFKGVAFFRG